MIAFSGPQNSGKTTLLNALKEETRLTVDDFKVSRAVQAKMGHDRLSDAVKTFEYVRDFQVEIAKTKLSHDTSVKCNSRFFVEPNIILTILTERSFADIAAYAQHWVTAVNTPEARKWLDDYIAVCKTSQQIYDGIVFTPSHKDIKFENDPNRANEESQKQMESLILFQCKQFDVPYHVVESVSINDRVAEVKKFISEISA